MSFLSSAFNTVANVGTLGVYGAVKGALTGKDVTPYTVQDPKHFQLGGDENYAKDRSSALSSAGGGVLSDARTRQATLDQAAALGMGQAASRANGQTTQGIDGRAGAYRVGEQQLGDGAGVQAQANGQGDAYNALGRGAANRAGPVVNTAGAAGDMANAAASRDASMNGVSDLRNFAQQGPGPSAAQSQMQQGSEASMASALALARSGRNGADPGAERAAMFQNAATQQQTNQQLGTLRANEETAWRGQQLQALTGAGTAAQGVRGQDLQSQGMALQNAQTNASLEANQRALNDATALGYGGLANNQYGQGANYNLGMQQAANASFGRGDAYNTAMQGLGNQSIAGGQNFYGSVQGLGNQALASGQVYDLGMQGQANSVMGQQLTASMGLEGQNSGNYMAAQQANQAADAQRDAAVLGMASSAAGVVAGAKSDEHSKTKIQDLEEQVRALGGDASSGSSGSPGKFTRPDVRQPDTAPLDEASNQSGAGVRAPAVDLRPARGYSYEYRDPQSPGAAPGRHFGPMAQDLERTPAGASTVHTGPDGMKMVDTPRLTMVNTAALSEQQRKTQELQEQVNALRSGAGPTSWADPGYDVNALDEAQRRQGGQVYGAPYAPPTARFADAQALGYR